MQEEKLQLLIELRNFRDNYGYNTISYLNINNSYEEIAYELEVLKYKFEVSKNKKKKIELLQELNILKSQGIEIPNDVDINNTLEEIIESYEKISPQLKLGIYTKLCIQQLYKYSPDDPILNMMNTMSDRFIVGTKNGTIDLSKNIYSSNDNILCDLLNTNT